MPGFGMIIGGAMSGWSEARLDEIKAEREARMKELDEQKQDQRIADEQQFRSREAEIGRNFEAGENEKNRAAQKESEQRRIDASGDVVTGDDGTAYSRVGSKATPITDDKGEKVKLAGSVKDKPAEVSTAEWLIQQGVAPDAATAWKMVRSARADPDKSRASIYKAWLDALTKGQLGTPDPAELEKSAREATDKTLDYLNMEEPSGKPSGASGAQEPSAEVIPSDPAKRVVGRTYINKQGQRATWRGNGWELE